MLVFITGATSGIGKSTAEIFAKNGYDLIITGRRQTEIGERLQNQSDGALF
jgi:3-hydroxy acid dehydrogenase / malonic semialdehyde reductase